MIRRTASVSTDPSAQGIVTRNVCAVPSCRVHSDVRSVALHRPGRAPEYHDLCFEHREEARAEGLLTTTPLVKLVVGGGAPKGAESSSKALRPPQNAWPAGEPSATPPSSSIISAPKLAVCPWPDCKSVPTGRGLCSTHLSRARNLQRPLPFPDTVEALLEQLPVWLDLWNGRLAAGPPPTIFTTTPKGHWARKPRPAQVEPTHMPTTNPEPLSAAPAAPEAAPMSTQTETEPLAPVEPLPEPNEPSVELQVGPVNDAPEAQAVATPVHVTRPKQAKAKAKRSPTRPPQRRGDKPLCLWGCGHPAKTCGLCDRDAARITSLTGQRPSLLPDLSERIEQYKEDWEKVQADRRAMASAAIRQRHAALRAQEAESAQSAAALQPEPQTQPEPTTALDHDDPMGEPQLRPQADTPMSVDVSGPKAARPVQVRSPCMWCGERSPVNNGLCARDVQRLLTLTGMSPSLIVDLPSKLEEFKRRWASAQAARRSAAHIAAQERHARVLDVQRPPMSTSNPQPNGTLSAETACPPQSAAPASIEQVLVVVVDATPKPSKDVPPGAARWARAAVTLLNLDEGGGAQSSAAEESIAPLAENSSTVSGSPSTLNGDTSEPPTQAPPTVTDLVASDELPAPPLPSQLTAYARALITRLKLGDPPAHLTGALAMLERAVLDERHRADRAELHAEERLIEDLSRGLFADPERRREAVRWLALRTLPTPAGGADLVALLELAVSLPQSTPYLVRALVRGAVGAAHGA